MRIRWLTIFLDFPADGFDAGVAFWQAVTGSGLSSRRGEHGEFATLLPPSGDPWLRAQRAADGPGGCHLDLHVDGPLDDAAAEAAALGARARHREEGLTVMESLSGFPFCLVGWDREAALPGPVHFPVPDGPATFANQLCLDIPPGEFARESRFWTSLLGVQATVLGARSEFACLGTLPGTAVRVLLQRRDEAPPGDRTAGHLDVGCDRRLEATRLHVAAGARVLAELPSWTVLADPAGRRYCLAPREPGRW